MKHILILLSLILLSSPLFGQETGVLYRYKTSSGFVWKSFGNDKLQTKFEGEIKDGGPNGQGTFTYLNGNKYVGETMDGTRHGQGTITFSSGDEYIGEWKGGTFNGLGTYTFSDGEKFEGEFKELGTSINRFIEDMRRIIGSISEVMTRLSAGDLTAELDEQFEGEFEGESEGDMTMTAPGELVVNDDGSGSWASSDGSQSGSWDADGNGTFNSPQGDGEMTVTHDAEGGISFTDSMGASGSFASDGTVTIQMGGEDEHGSYEDSGVEDAMAGAFGDSGESEEYTSMDASDEAFEHAETEMANAETDGAPADSDSPFGEESADDFTDASGEDEELPKPEDTA